MRVALQVIDIKIQKEIDNILASSCAWHEAIEQREKNKMIILSDDVVFSVVEKFYFKEEDLCLVPRK